MELYRYLFAPVLVAVAVWSSHHERRPVRLPEPPALVVPVPAAVVAPAPLPAVAPARVVPKSVAERAVPSRPAKPRVAH